MAQDDTYMVAYRIYGSGRLDTKNEEIGKMKYVFYPANSVDEAKTKFNKAIPSLEKKS